MSTQVDERTAFADLLAELCRVRAEVHATPTPGSGVGDGWRLLATYCGAIALASSGRWLDRHGPWVVSIALLAEVIVSVFLMWPFAREIASEFKRPVYAEVLDEMRAAVACRERYVERFAPYSKETLRRAIAHTQREVEAAKELATLPNVIGGVAVLGMLPVMLATPSVPASVVTPLISALVAIVGFTQLRKLRELTSCARVLSHVLEARADAGALAQ